MRGCSSKLEHSPAQSRTQGALLESHTPDSKEAIELSDAKERSAWVGRHQPGKATREQENFYLFLGAKLHLCSHSPIPAIDGDPESSLRQGDILEAFMMRGALLTSQAHSRTSQASRKTWRHLFPLASQHWQTLRSLGALVPSEEDAARGGVAWVRVASRRRRGEGEKGAWRCVQRPGDRAGERQLSGRQAPAHSTHRRLLITALGVATCGPCCRVAL